MTTTTSRSQLLLLAGGRLPDGSHAHSGGLEPAARLAGVTDLAGLEAYLRGRLRTAGLVAAGLAAAACGDTWPPERLDLLADARTASPAARRASRRQGRQLLRAAAACWPSPAYAGLPRHPHHPVVLGVAARTAGLAPGDAALVAAHGSVTGPASAAVRLLSLDPLATHAVLVGLAADVERTAAEAVGAVQQGHLPAASAPLSELAIEDHATWEVRLFAS